MHNRNVMRPGPGLVWVMLLMTPVVGLSQTGSQQPVSALGRLEPDGGIIRVAAPSTPQAVSGSILAVLNKDDLLFSP